VRSSLAPTLTLTRSLVRQVAHMSPAYLAFSIVLTLVPFCTLVMTATRDPGFIPRSSPGGSGRWVLTN